jgi:hypothetical protein
MDMENINNQDIPQSAIDQALEKLNEGYGIIQPYLHTLSNDDRSHLSKMGDKTLSLVEKTAELAVTNPRFCPSQFNLSDLNIDLNDTRKLTVLINRLQQIVREVEDTKMLAGHEAYVQTLSFYNTVKQAVHNKVEGAQAVFDELSKRFLSGRRGKSSPKS